MATIISFSLLSGLSITFAIPLFDYIFGDKRQKIQIDSISLFINKVFTGFSDFIQSLTSNNILDKETYLELAELYKNILSVTDPNITLIVISGLVLFITIIKNITLYLSTVTIILLKTKFTQKLMSMLYKKYLSLSSDFYDCQKLGDFQVRLTSDVSIISDFIINTLFSSLRDVILIIIYAAIAISINFKLFLLVSLAVPVFAFTASYFGKKIKKYSKKIQQSYSNIYSRTEEVFHGIKVVKLFSKENYELLIFNKENNQYFKSVIKSAMYQAAVAPLTEISVIVIGIIVIIIGGKMVLDKDNMISLGAFTAFIIAFFSILHPMKLITKAFTEVKRALVSFNRVFEILDLNPKIKNLPDAIAKNNFHDKIIVDIKKFSYDGAKTILENVKFEIKKGEKVAIVGLSGSGKTTIINLLERFYDPDEGSIIMDGIDLKDIKLEDLRRLFGTVSQETILFNCSVQDNIMYGSNSDLLIEDIIKAAKIANADEFIEEMSNSYLTILNPKATNLSGGQKQRICIARALVSNPPILIFDEATNSLDSDSESKVKKAIEKATTGKTVILIAHRISSIMNSDKIIVVDQGRVSGIGTHEELFADNEVYRKLYTTQFK